VARTPRPSDPALTRLTKRPGSSVRDPAIAEMAGSWMAMVASAGPRAGTKRKRGASARHAPAVHDRLAHTSPDIRRDEPCANGFGGCGTVDRSALGTRCDRAAAQRRPSC
jgi:hypothetical protein